MLIVEEDGEYGTGGCNAKMADWLFEEFGQQGRRFRAGQFRLSAEREPACCADREDPIRPFEVYCPKCAPKPKRKED